MTNASAHVWTEEEVRDDPGGFFVNLDEALDLSTRVTGEEGLKGIDDDLASEIRARLEDLGYASEESDPGNEDDPFGLRDPLARFQKDLGFHPRGQLDKRTEKALAKLVEWEGEVEDLQLPAPLDEGARGLFVRGLQYRLKKMGVYNCVVDGIYGVETLRAVIDFKLAFGLPLDPVSPGKVDQELYHLLCDPYALDGLMLEQLDGEPIVVTDSWSLWSKLGKPDVPKIFIYDMKFRFPGTDPFISETLPLVPATTKKGTSPAQRIKPQEGTCISIGQDMLSSGPIMGGNALPAAVKRVDDLADTQTNRTAVFLLQLWLWMLSGYLERADGLFGPKALDALRHFLKENQLDEDEYIVGHGKRYIVIAPDVFRELGTLKSKQEDIEHHEDYILKEVEEALTQEAEQDDPNGYLNQRFTDREALDRELHRRPLEDGRKERRGIFRWARRLYRGAKSIVVKVGRAVARGAKWFWKALGKLGRSALHLMSQALARIRASLTTFWKSLQEVCRFLARPIVCTLSGDAICVSWFENDFDVVSVYPGPAEKGRADLLARHTFEVRRTVYLFSLACKIVGLAIGMVMDTVKAALTGPIGWGLLGVKLARGIRAIMREQPEKEFGQFAGELA